MFDRSHTRATYVEMDQAEARLLALEAEIAALRAEQLKWLRFLDRARIDRQFGARSMADWTAARLDVTQSTARALVATARDMGTGTPVAGALAKGSMTFDRAVATAQLKEAGATEEEIDASRDRDLAGVRRATAERRRVTPKDERQIADELFAKIEPTADDRAYRISGLLPAYEGRIFEKALTERAELLPNDLNEDRGRRLADGLTALALDFLDRPDSPSPGRSGSSVTVFVNAKLADPTNGEAGATVANGPRVGPDTLERILCEGTVKVIGLDQGRPVVVSGATHQIPPAIRDFVLQRDGGCVISGCSSRYRLQPHHVIRRADGGTNDPDNLATLCWYHHHVLIHRYGYQLDPNTPPTRRRFYHRSRPRPP